MADGPCSEVISVQVSKRTLSDKKEIVCACCEKMTVELNEVKLELGSCWEIIRVLQEEIRKIRSSIQLTGYKRMKIMKTRNLIIILTSEYWTSISSNQQRNLQYTRRNLHQLPLQTSNQFEPQRRQWFP